jgi:hypothetical protein
MYDEPKAEMFTKIILRISMNIPQISRSDMLQKKNYSENSEMTQFRMIQEPYLTQVVSPKV